MTPRQSTCINLAVADSLIRMLNGHLSRPPLLCARARTSPGERTLRKQPSSCSHRANINKHQGQYDVTSESVLKEKGQGMGWGLG